MKHLFSNPTRVFGIAALVSAAGVSAALVSQHVYDTQPCPWCILQRLIFVLIACMSVIGMLWRTRAGQIVSAVTVEVLATCGIAAALWQHYVAAASQSCNLTLADRIVSGTGLDGAFPEVFAPRASCADSVVILFGVPYEFWSLALFAIVGTLAVLALLGKARRA